ncbi:MAG TPA: hypothetical protein VE078_04335 [Thermoanaerobaculia bacterium]|nr:hypothetical protein [Thermoanaerobaculia bacterium]
MRFRICWTLPLLAVLLPALPARAATEKNPPPDLSGRWKLNEDVTYRMMQGMRERGSGGGPDGMRGAGGGGRPGGHGGGRRPAGDGSRRRPEHHGGPPVSLESLDELTITQKEGVVTITDAAGRSRVLRTDGKKVREEGAPGGPATVKAKWKDRALEVTVKPQKGPKRTESWVITNDRKRLFLTLTMDGGPRVPIRRAYDLVSQGEDQETPAPPP